MVISKQFFESNRGRFLSIISLYQRATSELREAAFPDLCKAAERPPVAKTSIKCGRGCLRKFFCRRLVGIYNR